MLLVARSLDAEPLLISQLVRIAMLHIAANATATSLPRADADDADWKSLQTEFARASSINGMFKGLAGDSAIQGTFFQMSPSELTATFGPDRSLSDEEAFAIGKLEALLYVGSGSRATDRRFYLDRISETIEAAQTRFPEGLRMAAEVNARVQKEKARPLHQLKLLSGFLLAPLDGGPLEKEATLQATLRAAVTGCAVERHRSAHGKHLPATLDELVPAFLDAVPLDPFDGKPLRYSATNDTYVVYSVGADLVDDGGEFRSTVKGRKVRETYDVGFRVTDRRR